MSLTQNSLNNGARWEVRWVGKKGGIVHKVYDEDFGGALEHYTKLKDAQRKGVTLRCMNVGFPPPKRIIEHEVVKWQVVRRGGKRYKKKVIEHENLMEDLNAQGVWWCPYCIKLRRFVDRSDRGQILFECPVCDVSNYNWHVKRWNPTAKTVEFRNQGRKRGVRTRTRQRR